MTGPIIVVIKLGKRRREVNMKGLMMSSFWPSKGKVCKCPGGEDQIDNWINEVRIQGKF